MLSPDRGGAPTWPHLTLATFNVHCGVDGWGRPFDVVAECAELDADIVVMQESWAPDDGRPSTATMVADALGYRVTEEGLAHGRLYGPDPMADGRWGSGARSRHSTFRLDDDPHRRAPIAHRTRPFATGTWGIALLARVAVSHQEVVPLGRLRHDPARRVALTCRAAVGDVPLTVVGTHMSHLLQRSPVQYRRLRASLPSPAEASVVTGDMNLWGPPVAAFLRGWRRAVTGRTWPSSRPHSQLDHILISRSVSAIEASVAPRSGSDHRPVRAVLTARHSSP